MSLSRKGGRPPRFTCYPQGLALSQRERDAVYSLSHTATVEEAGVQVTNFQNRVSGFISICL